MFFLYYTLREGLIKYNDTRPLYAGTEQCACGHTYGPVVHHNSVVYYCKSGKGKIITENNNECIEIGPGQMFMVHADEITTIIADKQDPWHYVWVGFSGNIQSVTLALPRVINAEVGDIFDEVEKLLYDGEALPEKYLAILVKLFSRIIAPKHNDVPPAFRVRDYINLHYMDDINVDKISEYIGMDRRYLLRLFKRQFGSTIVEYIIKVRMEAAKNYLNQGYSVNKSAMLVGYPDQYNFSKMFKKYYGESPSFFKKGDV